MPGAMYAQWRGLAILQPYGNSNACECDVPKILGMETDENGRYSDKQIEESIKIHKEVSVALQICCSTLKFEKGLYIKKDPYNNLSWTSIWKK